jgi:mannose-6-phosphate isomerase-like protein (cupin superfamily)
VKAIVHPEVWLDDKFKFSGEWQGKHAGANICIIANHIASAGGGPLLHQHPYTETFIIREGTGIFRIGDRDVEASAGQILVVPANTPHRFSNKGPGPLVTIDIHENGEFVTEWLE